MSTSLEIEAEDRLNFRSLVAEPYSGPLPPYLSWYAAGRLQRQSRHNSGLQMSAGWEGGRNSAAHPASTH